MRYGWVIIVTLALWGLSGCGGTASTDIGASQTATELRLSAQEPQDTALSEHSSILDKLNGLRADAGMVPLSPDRSLQRAAARHARYLVANDLYTHQEQPTLPLYSGTDPVARAREAGYGYLDEKENIYAGAVTPPRALEILFSNIYHRLAFLDFGYDMIGIAQEHNTSYAWDTVYTYEIGRSHAREFTMRDNPKIVRWPAADQRGVMPVFYEEIPDPLPECSVSGYPISLQFNPLKSGKIELLSFRLFDMSGREVTDTYLMDRQNDPNTELDENTFVLFPLSRLEWATRYRVEVRYRENGGTIERLEWSFRTKELPGTLIRLEGSQEQITIKSGKRYFFYWPPAGCEDLFRTYTYRYSAGMQIQERIWDNNTIMFTATGEGEVEIRTNNGKIVSLRVEK